MAPIPAAAIRGASCSASDLPVFAQVVSWCAWIPRLRRTVHWRLPWLLYCLPTFRRKSPQLHLDRRVGCNWPYGGYCDLVTELVKVSRNNAAAVLA